MRASLALAAVSSLLVLAPGQAGASTAATPACGTGPVTVGDTTYGTPCADVIVAPAGVEAVQAGGGDDTIVPAPITALSPPCPSGCFLGVGSQTFEGGPGDDVVFGQRGNDTLRGGEGNDRLFGGIGDDLLRGGPGNDQLGGGFGADSIDGESGDDYVHGDGTIDRIADSGGGLDTLSFATGVTPGFGGTVSGFGDFPAPTGERGVRLSLGEDGQNANNGIAALGGGVDEVAGAGFETVIGTPFSDYIVGTGAQTIYGGGGADAIEGGGGGSDGGADGDFVNGAGAAVQRDQSKVSVGFMVAAQPGFAQLYAVGSSVADALTATYAPGPPATVAFHLAAGSFDQSASAAAGCSVAATATDATCTLAAPLDSLLLAGMGGADSISATGFPATATVVTLGGDGGDSLSGQPNEDVLVDGPDAGADQLTGLGNDDALLHNGGADQRFGGTGNDLFLSVSICDGDLIRGEADRDNASWARLQGEAVGANLGSGKAGEPGRGGRRPAPAAPSTPCRKSRTSRARKPATSSTATRGRTSCSATRGRTSTRRPREPTRSSPTPATPIRRSTAAPTSTGRSSTVPNTAMRSPSTARPWSRPTRTASSCCPTSRSPLRRRRLSCLRRPPNPNRRRATESRRRRGSSPAPARSSGPGEPGAASSSASPPARPARPSAASSTASRSGPARRPGPSRSRAAGTRSASVPSTPPATPIRRPPSSGSRFAGDRRLQSRSPPTEEERMAKDLYTAEAHVTGGRVAGHGRTSDGVLEVDLRPPAEAGGEGGGTNPEQLFAVGYAACFGSAIEAVARRRKLELGEVAIDSRVKLRTGEDRGFTIAAELHVRLASLGEGDAVELVRAAHGVCPYSNATRGSMEVVLTANGAAVEA